MSDEDSFLARWSKRKRVALAPQPDEAQATSPKAPSAEGAEEPFDLSALPDLETLTGKSDLSAFMHKAVPEALRNAALRKVWALDPSVRDYVGEALDYAWDWNSPGGVPGFGEAIASEETLAFVRNLLAGPNDNENVIDGAAAQGERPSAFANDSDEGPQTVAAVETTHQTTENTKFIEAREATAPHPEAPAPAPRRHRHGGALPG